MKPGLKKFILRTLLALSPVAAYVALYVALDPFKVIRPYNGVSIAPGDSLERIPNKRYVAIEGLKYYNPQHHYDSFIFGSSISSNFTAEAWKKHLPPDASVYHFTAGANTLTGIRDELRYLIDHGYPVRHALLIMEDEMFQRKPRLNELPYVAESIVLQRESHRIVALIVPNMDALDKAGIGSDGLDAVMKQNMVYLNSKLPSYSAVNDYDLRFEPFSKTPKGSIRRFMYK